MNQSKICFLCDVVNRNDNKPPSSEDRFFSFPQNDEKRQQWADALKIDFERVFAYDYLCATHFYPEEIKDRRAFGGRCVLKNTKIVPHLDLQVPNSSQASFTPLQQTPLSYGIDVNQTKVSSSPLINRIEKRRVRKKNNVRKRLHFTGDFRLPDMKDPIKATRYFRISKVELMKHRGRIRILAQKNQRLRKRISTYQSLLSHLRKNNKISEAGHNHLLTAIPDSIREVIARHLTCKKKRRYNLKMRQFALTLHFYSPSAYNFVRKSWNNLLPCPNSLNNWYRTVNAEPGFTKESLNTLEALSKKIGKPLACNLVIDEMSIRQEVGMSNNGTTYGIVDLGTNSELEADVDVDDMPKAKSALVFLVVSLRKNWKLPVGYFLIDSLTAVERAHLVTMCLKQLHSSNTHIKGITFDGVSTNFAMCKELGANFDFGTKDFNPQFPHPVTKEPVYAYPDPSHNIKNVRNALAETGPFFDKQNREINWKFLEKLHKKQSDNRVHYGNKIRNAHIKYKNDKMKVRLASQVFSESVADSLTFLKGKDKQNFAGVEGTVDFCEIFDHVFDLLNCRADSYYNAIYKPYKIPIRESSIKNLKVEAQKMIQYIGDLKYTDGKRVINSNRKTGFVGFIAALTNVFKIFESLKNTENYDQEYLLSFKLSQDHIENFFGAIRSRGGHNNNPNALQFKGAYKRLLVHCQVQNSANGNCEPNDISILNVPEIKKRKPKTCKDDNRSEAANSQIQLAESRKRSLPVESQTPPINEIKKCKLDNSEKCHIDENQLDDDIFDFFYEFEEDIRYDYEDSEPLLCDTIDSVIKYIGGFVVKSFLQRNKCKTCMNFIINNIPANEIDYVTDLTMIKSKGKLHRPSEKVFQLCKLTEQLIRQNIKKIYSKKFSDDIFNSIINYHVSDFGITCNHGNELTKFIVMKYIKIRKHHELFLINENRRTDKIRRKFTKLILFKNQ